VEFKKTAWIEQKRKDWPEGSLERHLKLNHSGCKSAFEASQKVRNQKKNETAAQPMKLNQDEEMKQIIKEVEVLTKDIDIDSLNLKVRTELANMPITTIEEALAWRDAWVKFMGERDVSGRTENFIW
jgi:hypothetical protein